MTMRNLDALLEPISVALIGASTRPGSIGNTVARNLLAGGFKGPIAFVNPKHSEVEGHPCHRTIGAVPEAPDVAVVATPPSSVPGIIGELARRGTRAAIVITAGLNEEQKIAALQAGREKIFRVLGPNNIGLILPHLGLNASFSHIAPAAGDIALLSQSGALVTAIIDWAAARSIGFSHVVSLGDMSDVDFGDMLDYLAGDTRSKAILLYMEAVTHAPKFMSAARRAARVKPVVVVKAGRHAASAAAAASHTGRLAGADNAYEAAFRRAGVLRVTDLSELFEATETLTRLPRLASEQLMILTNGGGAGVLAADRLADYDGELAPLSDAAHEKLSAVLPANWSKSNPVDVIGDASPERYNTALEILLEDPDPSALLVINCPTALASSTDIAACLVDTLAKRRAAGKTSKPVLTNWLGNPAAEEARRLFSAARIATYETPAAAARGFMQLVRYTRAQTELMRAPPAMDRSVKTDRAKARAIIEQALCEGTGTLDEADGKALVAAYGIPVVPTDVAADVAEVRAIAERIIASGSAAVVKILSPDVIHKSDVGGVRLNIATADDAVHEAERMMERVRTAVPHARSLRFTLSPMIRRPGAHELILGMSVDATFGPLIMFGAGGVSVEAVNDIALALPPLDLGLADRLMRQTRIDRLLHGYRDRPPADRAGIAAALVRISELIAENPEIRELDINPLLADAHGVIALDARVMLKSETTEPRVPMAIAPYPSDWEKAITIGDLDGIFLRPIKPEDEALYAEFMAHVTESDRRLRFLAPMKSLSFGFLARLTQIDYAREMAFVALDQQSGTLLGVARYAADPDLARAEYAVLVRSDFKGRGLGWALMSHLIAHARARGIGVLHGDVLAENITMLRMCAELGFEIKVVSDDPTMRVVVLPLDREARAG
jgi:acetyltransferase